jgi:HD-GYP domain-containing protein (c-di-GMP phosphodiesterase class II)
MAFKPLKIEHLALGMFVKLDCSWWRHPFATNKFKVTSRKDLETIKKITNLKLYYDPDLSDVLPPSEDEHHGIPSIPTEIVNEPDIPPVEVQEKTGEDPVANPEKRQERTKAFQERRNQIKRSAQAYEESTKQARVALKNLSDGNSKGLQSAEALLTNLTKSLSTERGLVGLLEVMNSADIDDPLFFHAMNVCVLSLLVGKEMELGQEELMHLGLGALSHDMGFLNLPRELRLTQAGFVHQAANPSLHVEQGIKSVEKMAAFPDASLKIIAQHHERLNGSGHPQQLAAEEISLLAKIVMAVDEYDDLCNNPNRQQHHTPYEALSQLYKNATVNQTGEFDPNILVVLIKALGVYPPGTVVELSDGSVGVVVSINSNTRTKPQIMLYVPNVPYDEAIIVDLSKDESLTIQKSFQPKELSKAVREYLSPHRVTGYFPSAVGMSVGASSHSMSR